MIPKDVQWTLRPDLRPEERCYVGTKDGKIVGYMQLFPNGTAGYWREPMQQAQPM